MDSSFHHHQQQQQQQQQGPLWYPPPASSSPQVGFHQPQPILPPLPPHHLPHPHYQQHHQQHMMGVPPPGPPPPHPYRGHPPHLPQPPPPFLSTGPLHTLPYRPPPVPHHLPPPHPQPYPPSSQMWGAGSFSQNAGWDYPERSMAYNNEEDWAARARAWAAAKSVTDNHHAQSQFMPVGIVEDNRGYHDQYQPAFAPPPSESQPPSIANSNDQHLGGHFMDLRKRENDMYGSPSFGPVSTSYAMDGRVSYNTGAEAIVTDSHHIVSPCQRSYGSTSSIYEQEVPYTYSSAPAGNRDTLDQNESHHRPEASSFPGPHSAAFPVQRFSMEQPQLMSVGQSNRSLIDTADEPRNYESGPVSAQDTHKHIGYRSTDPAVPFGMVDHDAITTSLQAWTPATTPGTAFSQIPSVPSRTQFEPSFLSQSSVPLHPAPVFGRIPGPNFGASIPSITASFVPGSGASLHHATTFSADAIGSPNVADRPKKAAVPNWLREEIIKKKSIIASAGGDHSNGDSRFSGSEDADIISTKHEQADSKSIDSTRSTEEEDVEDDVEATRDAAINQEIKRVLTEVLLKVTDELFDEIATKVLNEDDLTNEGNETLVHGKHKVSLPPSVPTPQGSAPVVLPVKLEDKKWSGAIETSSSRSPGGDLLGLANYASDNDDEHEASTALSSGIIPDASQKQPNNGEFGEMKFEKGNKFFSNEESNGDQHDIEIGGDMKSINGPLQDPNLQHCPGDSILKSLSSAPDDSYLREKASQGIPADSIPIRKVEVIEALSAIEKDAVTEKKSGETEYKRQNHIYKKPVVLERQSKEPKTNLDTARDPVKRSTSIGSVQDAKLGSEKMDHENDHPGDLVSHEDRKTKGGKDKKDSIKDGAHERRVKQESTTKESDSRSTSKHGVIKNEKKDNAREKSDRNKEYSGRKKDRTREEEMDRLVKSAKDQVRYNGKRSPSPISRGKNSKESSLSTRGSVSSDEPSENAKRRKLQSYKHSSSPSPTRSKRRQVSRSPHSKHSHRRHSPYSPAERRRRSRSRTPVHRRSAQRH